MLHKDNFVLFCILYSERMQLLVYPESLHFGSDAYYALDTFPGHEEVLVNNINVALISSS